MNSTTNPTRVLVVDDDPINLQLVSRTLSRAGFSIVSACSGEEALAWLSAEHCDVVISDVVMPRISGFELLQIIRSSRPWLPVILMSSLDKEDISEALAMGAVAIFEKPLDRPAFVAGVAAAARNSGRLLPTKDAVLAGVKSR